MNVFLQKYLEAPTKDIIISKEDWTWIPEGKSALEIYACGASTNTRQSTYANETDNRSDTDRPNEGFLAA